MMYGSYKIYGRQDVCFYIAKIRWVIWCKYQKYKLLICASTNVMYTFDTYIIILLGV